MSSFTDSKPTCWLIPAKADVVCIASNYALALFLTRCRFGTPFVAKLPIRRSSREDGICRLTLVSAPCSLLQQMKRGTLTRTPHGFGLTAGCRFSKGTSTLSIRTKGPAWIAALIPQGEYGSERLSIHGMAVPFSRALAPLSLFQTFSEHERTKTRDVHESCLAIID